jgi:hypothetical protein
MNNKIGIRQVPCYYNYNVLKMDDLFVNGVWFSLLNRIGQDHYS